MSSTRRRATLVTAIAAAGLLLGAAAASAVIDAPVKDDPSAESAAARTYSKPATRTFEPASTAKAMTSSAMASSDRASTSRIDVKRTLRGLVKAHNRLVRKHNGLVRKHNKLAREVVKCEKIQNVSQYGGYDYQGQVGATTALDYTDLGDSVDGRMLVYVC